MKRVKPEILRILKQQPECRDDDVMLAFCIWENEGLQLTEQQKQNLRGLSKPGSIVRTRAHIQNVERRFRRAH
jgi:hypothetical protein